jgi:chromate transport protein ChrA
MVASLPVYCRSSSGGQCLRLILQSVQPTPHSLPGAISAYGLAVGVSNINDTLPAPVYALLSGLNASTVGIIALAAVQLSQKAITDKLTRILVFLGGSAGMLYNALWYYPVLMVLGGVLTIAWDYKWGHNAFKAAKGGIFGLGNRPAHLIEEEQIHAQDAAQRVVQQDVTTQIATSTLNRVSGSSLPQEASSSRANHPMVEEDTARIVPANLELRLFSWKLGSAIVACFFVTFAAVMVLRGTLRNPPLGFSVFANLYLAGTIIFGGGPVVIPLLREYVVAEGWVSPRDFLLGLAICQAFPGPNFNFAVYLAALAVGDKPNRAAGAVIGYIAIFAPGLILHTGAMGFWKVLRNRRWFTSCLRGVNATAVGLIYTAVYRLWEQGFLSEAFSSGSSLGREPWWVVVTATSFVGGRWFGVSPPIAILLGGAMGLIWYGVVTA